MGGFEGSNGRRDGAIPSRGPEARGAKAEGSGGVGGLLSGRVPAGGRQAVLGESARVAPRAAQVSEDGGDDVGVENEGEHLHFAAAAGTAQRIDLEGSSFILHLLQWICPVRKALRPRRETCLRARAQEHGTAILPFRCRCEP